MEKFIKISAVFKVEDKGSDIDGILIEIAMSYDAMTASKKGKTKLDLYNGLKQVAGHQVRQVCENAKILDVTAEEVKEYNEQQQQ